MYAALDLWWGFFSLVYTTAGVKGCTQLTKNEIDVYSLVIETLQDKFIFKNWYNITNIQKDFDCKNSKDIFIVK